MQPSTPGKAPIQAPIADAVIATTFDHVVTKWSPDAEAIYRRPAAHALGQPISEAVGAALDPAAIVHDGGMADCIHHTTEGAVLEVRVAAAVMDDGYLLVCTEHTASRNRQRTIEKLSSPQASHDCLTGLPNRIFAIERISESLRHCSGCLGVTAVLSVEVADFTSICDSLGHDAGDAVLGVVRRLREAVRGNDMVARLGGDTFAVLLMGTLDCIELYDIACRLHAALSRPLVAGAMTVCSTASIGIAEVFPGDRRSAEQILGDADLAMYAAKTTGKGQTHYFTPALRLTQQGSGRVA